MKTAAIPARGVPPEVPKGSRIQSTDCTERPRAAANREAVVELIVAGPAGTPHPGRREWRNRPRRGRRLLVAGRSSSPSIIGARFSKRTHMMAPVKPGNFVFPREKCISMSKGGQIEDVFLRNEPK